MLDISNEFLWIINQRSHHVWGAAHNGYTIFHVRNGRFGSSQPREPVVQPAVIQHILSHAGHQIGAEGQGVRLGHHGLKKRGRPAGYSAKKLAFIAG